MVSNVIEKKQEALFETLGDDGAQLQKIMDTRRAAKSFLESCRLRFNEDVTIEVFNSRGVKECLGHAGGIPLSVARLFENCFGDDVLEKIIGRDMNTIGKAPSGLVYDADVVHDRAVSAADLIRSATDLCKMRREGHRATYPGICTCCSSNSEEGSAVDSIDKKGVLDMVTGAKVPDSSNNGIFMVSYEKDALNDEFRREQADVSESWEGNDDGIDWDVSDESSERSEDEINFDAIGGENRPSNFLLEEESTSFTSCLGLCRHPTDECSLGSINAKRLLKCMSLEPKKPSDMRTHFDVELRDSSVRQYVLLSGRGGRQPSFFIGSAVFEASAFLDRKNGETTTKDEVHRQMITKLKDATPWATRELALVCCQRFCRPDARVFMCVHTSASPITKVTPVSDIRRETKYGSFHTVRMPQMRDFSGRTNDRNINWRSVLYTKVAKGMVQRALSVTHRNIVTETYTGWVLSPWSTQDDDIEFFGNVMRPLYAEDGGLGLKWGGHGGSDYDNASTEVIATLKRAGLI